MKSALLIDIGSTYTKAVMFDLRNLTVLNKSQFLTTSEDNILKGLKIALKGLKGWEKASCKLACSSAAGGLKIIAIGLVPDFTAEAARRAALGAGSRILKTYCFELTDNDLEEIYFQEPDIILLAGGTDGGNKEVILNNARLLAGSRIKCPIIIAGNRTVAEKIKDIFASKGKISYITENVMPELEELNIEPAHRKIRDIFLTNIIRAKGLDSVRDIIDGVIMPTPAAVLDAASLLARGFKDIEGAGELLVVDVGGATTDIHSIASGKPVEKEINWRGLKEPFIKRTVEGDIGIRFNAPTLLKLIGIKKIIEGVYNLGGKKINPAKLEKYIKMLHKNVEYLPANDLEKAIDIVMARNAVRIATARHVGKLKTIYTPMGPSRVQEGKNLMEIKTVIGTGGVIVNSGNPEYILAGTLYENQNDPRLMAPTEPDFLVDREYIMAACGILASIDSVKALKMLKKYID